MVTSYYDVRTNKLLHEAKRGFVEDGIQPNSLILNGMLLRVDDPNMFLISPTLFANRYRIGRGDEDELIAYLNRFAEFAVSDPVLDLDSASEDYVMDNLHRVIDYLVPKLRQGDLEFYTRYGESPGEDGAMAFVDYSNSEESPVFLFPVFGLKAVTFARGFVPWRPSRKETYLPDLEPTLCRPPSFQPPLHPKKTLGRLIAHFFPKRSTRIRAYEIIRT